jgi:integrase
MYNSFTGVFAQEMHDHLSLLYGAGWYVKKAKCYLRSLDRFMAEHKVSDKVLEERLVSGWLASKPVKAETKRNMYSEINRFAKYLSSLGFAAAMPEAPKQGKDYVPYVFSEDEFGRIIHAADNFLGSERITKATYFFPVVLRLLYCCGLRLGEALSLAWRDVDLSGGIITVRAAKNMKQRFVPMSDSMRVLLAEYRKMAQRMDMCREYLFETDMRYGADKPMRNLAFEYWFARVLRAAGIEYIKENPNDRGPCPHCLRHLFVYDSFLKSESEGRGFEETVPCLSAYLGHESLSALEKYLSKDYTLYRNSHRRVSDHIKDVFPEVSFN